jgi:polyhydroxyalkanoate synthesis repressor PhaR
VESTQGQQQKTGDARIIKRYANRKLYDTRDSRYVTLVQIAEYVRAGEDVQIIDNTTKEDLTHVTLAQIIYEEEKKDKKGGEADARRMSIGTLREFIQAGSQRLMDSVREGPLGKLMSRRDEAPAEGSKAAADESPETRRVALFEKSREALAELQQIADDRIRGLIHSAIAPVQHLQAEVKRLQERIDELEAKLVRASQPRGRRDDTRSGDS